MLLYTDNVEIRIHNKVSTLCDLLTQPDLFEIPEIYICFRNEQSYV